MHKSMLNKIITLGLLALAVWVGLKYIFPILLPFLLGTLLAFAAEPLVCLGVDHLGVKRPLASGIGVLFTVIMLSAVVSLVGAVAVKEIGNLAGFLPDVSDGTQILQDHLINLANKTPEGLRNLAQKTVLEIFDDSSAVVKQISDKIPSILGAVASGVGNSVLGVGTGILAAFFISARLPKMRQGIKQRLPDSWNEKYLPALKRVYHNLGGWLKAQGKLALITWGVVTAGFFAIRLPYGPVWALLVALVDAIPILGTGMVLVPWALVDFLQGERVQGVILLGTYVVAAITRTVLEPKIVGKQLGLDPLVTLIAVYGGYRLWGFLGLLLAPIAVSAAKSIWTSEKVEKYG